MFRIKGKSLQKDKSITIPLLTDKAYRKQAVDKTKG